MSTKTSIEWTDVTWNPVRGCSLVSAGCTNCYAMKQAHRFSGKGKPYEGLTELGPRGPRWNGNISMVPKLLDEPLHWKQPRRVFVNSMSDLFHEDVPWDFIGQVFLTMNQTPQHTYQILTKRPKRMLEFSSMCASRQKIDGSWPMPNVWLGVSVEDQATADERIPVLLATPTGVRFVSYEPALGPVDFWGARYPLPDGCLGNPFAWGKGINWLIIGGESGPRARPFDLAWARSAIAESKAGECAVFVKQLGANWFDSDNGRGIRGSALVPVDCEWEWVDQKDKKGGDIREWPEDLRVREFPR